MICEQGQPTGFFLESAPSHATFLSDDADADDLPAAPLVRAEVRCCVKLSLDRTLFHLLSHRMRWAIFANDLNIILLAAICS